MSCCSKVDKVALEIQMGLEILRFHKKLEKYKTSYKALATACPLRKRFKIHSLFHKAKGPTIKYKITFPASPSALKRFRLTVRIQPSNLLTVD